MKVLQINVSVNSGSTGRIAENIGQVLIDNGHESYIAYGRTSQPSNSQTIKIGSQLDTYIHILKTRLSDRHGFGSRKATENFIREIDSIKPDIIGLHNLHGYYIHIDVLFEYIKRTELPVVWTFHDCWPFTGHCSYFDRVNCEKWMTFCTTCPLTTSYPASYGLDQSRRNFEDKRRIFQGVKSLRIVSPSIWLKELVSLSFLQAYPTEVIHNGIDLNLFKVSSNNSERKTVLGVASIWSERKGLADFRKIRELLNEDVQIVLIGLSKNQIENLPSGIIGIERTESIRELVEWYNIASVFVNPTYVDNFPTTNLEALSCGTPVITYNTGGSPESIDGKTGIVVPKGDVKQMAAAINKVIDSGKETWSVHCRRRAEELYNYKDRFMDYLNLYEQMLNVSK